MVESRNRLQKEHHLVVHGYWPAYWQLFCSVLCSASALHKQATVAEQSRCLHKEHDANAILRRRAWWLFRKIWKTSRTAVIVLHNSCIKPVPCNGWITSSFQVIKCIHIYIYTQLPHLCIYRYFLTTQMKLNHIMISSCHSDSAEYSLYTQERAKWILQ